MTNVQAVVTDLPSPQGSALLARAVPSFVHYFGVWAKDIAHDPRSTFATFLSALPSADLRRLLEEAKGMCLPSKDILGGMSEAALQFPAQVRHAFLSEHLESVPTFPDGQDLLTVMVRSIQLYHPSLPLRLRCPVEFDSSDLEDYKALQMFLAECRTGDPGSISDAFTQRSPAARMAISYELGQLYQEVETVRLWKVDQASLRRFSRIHSILPLLDHAIMGRVVDRIRGARDVPVTESTTADMEHRHSLALKAWDAATGVNPWFERLQYPGIKRLPGMDPRGPHS